MNVIERFLKEIDITIHFSKNNSVRQYLSNRYFNKCKIKTIIFISNRIKNITHSY